ncbi:MAG TPA: hypothetical protein VFD98_17420 [Terracidiphilus sp.]|nr:hypothetical protein [Terracidiphilus sp.]
MTNLRQDRVPDQTLSQGSVPGGRSAADGAGTGTTRCIVLGVRLWTRDSGGQAAAVSWQSAAPIAHLALDLITASGGATEPAKGSILRAGFYSAQSALLMVRRLQWALQGFAEREESRGVAAAILIHSLEDPAGEPIASALENAEPGQILLSGAIAESVNQLPNVALRASAQAGLVEVQWRSSEPDASGAADEQSALRLIRELGREDPVPFLPQAPVSKPTQPPPAEAPASPVATDSFVPSRRDEDEEVPAGGGKKKWLILGVAAAVLVIAAILIIPGLVSGHREKAAAPAVPDASARPVEPVTPVPPPPSTSDTAVKPVPAKPLPQKPERIPVTDKTKPSPDGTTAARAPAAPAGTCELTEGEIPRSLSRAESYMHAGRLTDAQAVYQRLLGCPSARQRAAEGLQLVKQRIAAGPSEQ